MRYVGATLGVAVTLVFALMNFGCVGSDQPTDASLVKSNRELERLVQEKDAEIARLTRERDAFKKAYEDSASATQRHTGVGPTPPGPSSGGVPASVVMGIEALGKEYAGVFEFDRQAGRLRFAADVTFDSGSGAVKDEAHKALLKLAEVLADPAARDVKVAVLGHTDSDPIKKIETIAFLNQSGKTPDNTGLSDLRAESVAGILATGGVKRAQITTEGRGAKDPIAGNSTVAGKAKNRRVEIFLK